MNSTPIGLKQSCLEWYVPPSCCMQRCVTISNSTTHHIQQTSRTTCMLTKSSQAVNQNHRSLNSIEMPDLAKFNLRTWASNSPQLNTMAQQEKVADRNTPTNVLGMHWNINTDKLSLAPKRVISLYSTLVTKRDILQDSSKIFDPISLAAPITVRAKLLLQKTCTLG